MFKAISKWPEDKRKDTGKVNPETGLQMKAR